MITNILDRRSHSHKWTAVDAVAEATWHDNLSSPGPTHDNADGSLSIELADTFEVRANVSVAEAVLWAQRFPDEVTLYLYDAGSWGYRTEP